MKKNLILGTYSFIAFLFCVEFFWKLFSLKYFLGIKLFILKGKKHSLIQEYTYILGS